MRMRVLVAGFSTRHVARSASNAGHAVYAVDHFCDQDLSWYTRDAIRFEELADILPAVEEMCSRHAIDLAVVTSGAESLGADLEVCGTSAELASEFLDKLKIQHFFENLDVPTPRLVPEGTYPAMVKPRTGAGGWRNRVVYSTEDLDLWNETFEHPPSIIQELVGGVPSSVCCLADGTRAMAVAVNEQILRGEEEACAFGFAGSITPYITGQTETMIRYAEKIAAESGCRGTVGIDFMAGDEVRAIEINPRFQATLDTVEMSTGWNLFSRHVDACRGKLPGARPPMVQYAVRSILFAEKDLVIGKDLRCLHPAVADIPWPKTPFEAGHAIISVYGWGRSRSEALAMLDKHNRLVRQYIG